jgi:twitching motility protein PilT
MTMRVIADQIPTPEQLKIEPEMLEWVRFPKGLIMINGATGTGKSNTLAAMIRKIQTEQRKKIITIEKPIEFLYPNHPNSIVVQREVGRDTLSYSHALDSAMRQAPNVILVGETRNATETDALLYAADTGHLAMSTMHTNSAPETLQRIMRMYKGEEQQQVLSSLSELARGFANQVLLTSLDPRNEGSARFAVREILTVDEDVEDLILAGNVKGLRSYQMDLEKSMEHGLIRAVRDGRATLEEARSKTTRPLVFDKLVRPEDTRVIIPRPF